MSDFPTQLAPLFISTFSRYAGDWAGGSSTGTPAGNPWPSANRAIYLPVWVPWPYPVERVFWVNGSSATSNKDFGVFTRDGTKIYSTGSTAGSGASTLQYVTVATEFLLTPGVYYFALAVSGTTNAGYFSSTPTVNRGRLGGVLQQDSALPLPATATFATLASAVYPLIGVTRTTTGF